MHFANCPYGNLVDMHVEEIRFLPSEEEICISAAVFPDSFLVNQCLRTAFKVSFRCCGFYYRLLAFYRCHVPCICTVDMRDNLADFRAAIGCHEHGIQFDHYFD